MIGPYDTMAPRIAYSVKAHGHCGGSSHFSMYLRAGICDDKTVNLDERDSHENEVCDANDVESEKADEICDRNDV